MIVRARAPLRISFGGGGTDVAPYCLKYGGLVLSTTIDKYAYCTVRDGPSNGYQIKSADMGIKEAFPNVKSLKYNGNLDLAKAAVKTLCAENGQKLELSLFSEAPPGSGLGSSSALMVSVVKAVAEFLGVQMNSHSIAELAFRLEREELKLKGGYQDQYASTFGGLNFIEFSNDQVVVNPLRIRGSIEHELLACLVLIDTGRSRLSSNILARQIRSYEREDAFVLEVLSQMKDITLEMKAALLRGDLARFGELLSEEWNRKKKLDKMISNPEIDSLFKRALRIGAIGGKVLGAGNGGHVLFFVDFLKKREFVKSLSLMGYSPISFNFDHDGVVSWKLGEDGVFA